jgi:enediyne biosynthesis protein E4
MLGLLLLACIGSDGDSGTDPSTDSKSTDSESTDSESTATLTEHGQVTCADPTLRETEGPLVILDHGQAWEDQRPLEDELFQYGMSLAVEDFDGDGLWDVFLGHVTGGLLFLNSGSGEWVPDANPLPDVAVNDDTPHWRSRGITATDLDGDGDPDLVIGTAELGVLVWRNDGGTFTDVTAASGIDTAGLEANAVAVGDLDGDGDLDLFLGHDAQGNLPPEPGQDNALFLNQGDLVFEEVSDRLSTADRDGYTQSGTLVDLDNDGDVDLYVTNHRPEYRQSRYLLNDGDGVLSYAQDAGLDGHLQGMGVGLGDVNDDGLPDLLVSSWGELALFESQATGVWARTEKVRELVPAQSKDQVVAWGNQLVDIDNDGDLDAVVGFGSSSLVDIDEGDPEEQPDGLWLREGEVFVDAAAEWGLRQKRDTRGIAVFDYNGDGWLDVLKSAVEGRAVLWTQHCGDASWLVVDLAQPAPNTRAIGARVVVEAGSQTWTRWVTGSSTSYVTSVPPQVHFGLGDLDTVDRLTVIWPDGTQDTFDDLPTRQRLSVTRPPLGR